MVSRRLVEGGKTHFWKAESRHFLFWHLITDISFLYISTKRKERKKRRKIAAVILFSSTKLKRWKKQIELHFVVDSNSTQWWPLVTYPLCSVHLLLVPKCYSSWLQMHVSEKNSVKYYLKYLSLYEQLKKVRYIRQLLYRLLEDKFLSSEGKKGQSSNQPQCKRRRAMQCGSFLLLPSKNGYREKNAVKWERSRENCAEKDTYVHTSMHRNIAPTALATTSYLDNVFFIRRTGWPN